MTANVALTDTFDQWRVKSNELIVMTQSDGMNNIIKSLDTTNSTSNTTGSIITAGGVGIAKSVTIGENLEVHGNVVVDGDTTISGNLVFGDADSDQVTFTADINSHIIPNANLSFNLGNTTMYWANTWTGHLTSEQKTDSGKPALTISSLDTDQIAVDINASQIDADVIDISADAVTTAKVIDITADALTTGSGIYVDDNSASTSTRKTVEIIQNNAAALAATALQVQSDGGITGMTLDKNFTDVAAATVTGLHVDFDRTVPGSGTANFTDIGINLDVNAAGLGTTTTTGLDIDVVGATSGTHTATGINVAVGSADTNYALITSGGNIGISTAAPATIVHITGTDAIVIPVGTTAQRGTATAGGIRYNSTTSQFEGYSGSSWGSLGGLIDVDQDTKIIAETSAGADNDDLDFYTAGTQRMKIDETGIITVGVDGTGYDVTLFGDTSGRFMKWDQSADLLFVTDNAKVGFGAVGADMQMYHTGSHSYIDNAVGTLNIATTNSGIAVSIGHTTSETTVNDNLSITGNLTVGVDDTGGDVKFFGATASAFMGYAQSNESLIIRGGPTNAGSLLLQTAEPSVVDGNKLGRIDFQAPVDTAGTDAILVAASIWAEADATFSASVNATELVFATGASETATEKMRITSDGRVGIGTSTPGVLFQIHSSSDHVRMSLDCSNSSGDDWVFQSRNDGEFWIRNDDAALNVMTMTPAGLTTFTGALTVGVNDTGHDILFYGDAAGAHMSWDASADSLFLRGATADHATTSAGRLVLQTAQVAVVDGDMIGRIDFQAPLETQGSDGAAVSASIWAEADDTFTATVNKTDLVFACAVGEVAAENMRLTSMGSLGIGVVPETAVYSDFTQLQVGANGNWGVYDGGTTNGEMDFMHNAYKHTSASHRRIANDEATMYRQGGGKHTWFTVAAGATSGDISFTQIMTMFANANIGIGTGTDSGSRLHVNGRNDADGYSQILQVSDTGDATKYLFLGYDPSNDYAEIGAVDAGTGFKSVRIGPGNVLMNGFCGIGTDSPGGKLHVEQADPGSGNALIKAKLTNNSNNPIMMLVNENSGGNSTDNNGLWIDNRGGAGQSYSIRVLNSSTEIFCVRANGNVGCGVAVPASKLHIQGANARLTIQASATDPAYLQFLPDNGADTSEWLIEAHKDSPYTLKFYRTSSTTPVLTMQGTDGDIYPGADNSQDFGSASLRWANIYSADLHLSNEGKEGGNEVDGTMGNWTVQEGEENLFVINNKTGKQFKLNLTEV